MHAPIGTSLQSAVRGGAWRCSAALAGSLPELPSPGGGGREEECRGRVEGRGEGEGMGEEEEASIVGGKER